MAERTYVYDDVIQDIVVRTYRHLVAAGHRSERIEVVVGPDIWDHLMHAGVPAAPKVYGVPIICDIKAPLGAIRVRSEVDV